MKVEHLFDAIESDEESGGDYENEWLVMAEDRNGKRYHVVGHRTGVDDKGEACMMLELES